MPTAKIPPVLRSSTGGEKQVAVDGSTVGDALRSLASQHPDTERQLFGDGGELNRYVNVYKNDEDVRVLDGLETPLSESDTLMILPAMAGGCEAPGHEGWMPSFHSGRGHGSPRS
jgi:sulfur-carrier protein